MIKRYSQFVFERRDVESREKVSASSRICSFLKKHGFKYEGPGNDSEIFVSFKTGDFETIVPPKSLGGSQYSSPQGFYCFDMNIFKKRMFGDDEIAPENYSPSNLNSAGDKAIPSLGLGYGNNGNVVDKENMWNGIPRYLYLVKAKPGSLILSSNSNSLKIYDPLMKLLRGYSHLFLKSSDADRFSKSLEKDTGLGKKSYVEIEKHFRENSSEYKEQFMSALRDLFSAMDKDKNTHLALYDLIMRCSGLISRSNMFVRFTLICKAIGIDGFTQRKGENSFIHPSPEQQTVLLSDGCVEDLIKIDLMKEGNIDRYVKGQKADEEQEAFFASLKKGDCIYNRKTRSYSRYEGKDSFLTGRKGIGKWRVDIADLSKVDLSASKEWQFVKSLKPGDWIKISAERGILEEHNPQKFQTLYINITNSDPDEYGINLKMRNRRIIESDSYDAYINYSIDGKRKNEQFKYKLNRRAAKDMPLFDPESANIPVYKFWKDNQEELEKKGATLDTLIDEYDRSSISESIEELFEKPSSDGNTRRGLNSEYSLMTLLRAFQESYVNKVMDENLQGDLHKGKMTLYLYRGDLQRPAKVVMSSFGL